MAAFLPLLADENVPKQAILALRNLGLDIALAKEPVMRRAMWIQEAVGRVFFDQVNDNPS